MLIKPELLTPGQYVSDAPAESTIAAIDAYIAEWGRGLDPCSMATVFKIALGHSLVWDDAFGWYAFTGRRWQPYPGIHQTLRAFTRRILPATSLLSPAPGDDAKRHQKWLDRYNSWTERLLTPQGATPLLTHAKELMRADIARDFDQAPHLLNCQNGTVDLREAAIREARAEDRITRLTGVAADFTGESPVWDAFFARLFDADLGDWLSLFLGYALTGETTEQILPIFYGQGNNGKSTLIEHLRDLLGDYAASISPEVLVSYSNDNTRTEQLAGMRAARLLFASEPRVDTPLDEGLVKQLTGGDTIRARRLYHDSFEYRPHFKVILSCNSQPVVKSQDRGIWRRLRLVPFLREIQNAHPRFRATLECETVLGLACHHASRWFESGLGALPERVKESTACYRVDMDPLGAFFDDCILQDQNAIISKTEMYRVYTAWCKDNGFRELTSNALSRKLHERGLEDGHAERFRFWRGFKLRLAS